MLDRHQRRSAPSPPSHKSLFWAGFLQCIPLLGAAGCFINGASDQNSLGTALLLWVSILFWGLGYLYVGAFGRLAIVVLGGPILAIGACLASSSTATYDYVPADGENDPADVRSANRASIQTGIIVTLAVMILAVDAARVAAAHNARLRDVMGIEPP
jgi:hypothetical protein